MQDHYKVLGVRRKATPAEIKAAFRELARQNHPDVAGEANKDQFIAIKEAYEVLSDPERRSSFDAALTYTETIARQREQAEAARAQSQGSRQQYFQTDPEPRKTAQAAEHRVTSADMLRMTTLFNQGRLREAETKANEILEIDPRSPLALAVIADLARTRGDIVKAAKYYGLAAQYAPENEIYLKRHTEMLDAMGKPADGAPRAAAKQTQPNQTPLTVAAFLEIAMVVYVVLARETPALPMLAPISTWTISLISMLSLSGVVLGACLSASNALGRFSVANGSTIAKVPPGVALMFIALFNFWAAILIYLLIGLTQKAMNSSITKLASACAATVVLFACASLLKSPNAALQTLAWGGNLVYLGGILGWLAADSLKPR